MFSKFYCFAFCTRLTIHLEFIFVNMVWDLKCSYFLMLISTDPASFIENMITKPLLHSSPSSQSTVYRYEGLFLHILSCSMGQLVRLSYCCYYVVSLLNLDNWESKASSHLVMSPQCLYHLVPFIFI